MEAEFQQVARKGQKIEPMTTTGRLEVHFHRRTVVESESDITPEAAVSGGKRASIGLV